MVWARVLVGALSSVAVGAVAIAAASRSGANAEADRAWQDIAARGRSEQDGAFDMSMVASLPEVAQRYFRHAIAPGTPIMTTAELTMRGTFLLGDKSKHQAYRMEARQILRPPLEFVWIPRLSSGWMRISGADALVQGRAWTRFWLAGLVPVADARSSPDLVRSAAFRAAMEAIWVPASLLPGKGVEWEQAGPDAARLRVPSNGAVIVLEMLLHPNGAVKEISGARWSDANPDKSFRLQPFGGTIEQEGRFGGYTIPTRVQVGNHYGTDDYLPFFQAEIVTANYPG